MSERIVQLIQRLTQEIRFAEQRSPADSTEHLEAVVWQKDLARCCEILREVLGQPLKDFSQPTKIDPGLAHAIDQAGGVWDGQCLFCTKEDGRSVAYALLWPWGTDPSRVTLKVGFIEPG